MDIGGLHLHRFAPATGAPASGRRPIFRPRSVCASGCLHRRIATGSVFLESRRFIRDDAVPQPDLPDNRLNEGPWRRTARSGWHDAGHLTDAGSLNRDDARFGRVLPDRCRSMAVKRPTGMRITNTMAWPARRLRHGGYDKERALRLRLRCQAEAIANRRDFSIGCDRGFPTARASMPKAVSGTAASWAGPV